MARFDLSCTYEVDSQAILFWRRYASLCSTKGNTNKVLEIPSLVFPYRKVDRCLGHCIPL